MISRKNVKDFWQYNSIYYKICCIKCLNVEWKKNIVLVPYMDSAHNMDTPNIFKSNKFYRHMTLHIREEKHLKR